MKKPDISVVTFAPDQLLNIDVVVNSSNNRFRHGSGIAKALEQLAGPELQEACKKILSSRGNDSSLAIGAAYLTTAGQRLRKRGVKHIVHAIGMGYDSNRHIMPACQRSVGQASFNSLLEAASVKAETIVFPIMCAHHGGLSPEESAEAIFLACRNYFTRYPDTSIHKIFLNGYNFRDPMTDYRQTWNSVIDLWENLPYWVMERLPFDSRNDQDYNPILIAAIRELKMADQRIPFSVNGSLVYALEKLAQVGINQKNI